MEGARDNRQTIINEHKFICEYSQHVLYNYVMLILWYLFVSGFIVSSLDLLPILLDHIYIAFLTRSRRIKRGDPRRLEGLTRVTIMPVTHRESTYLRYTRRTDLVKYGELCSLFSQHRGVSYKQKRNKKRRIISDVSIIPADNTSDCSSEYDTPSESDYA